MQHTRPVLACIAFPALLWIGCLASPAGARGDTRSKPSLVSRLAWAEFTFELPQNMLPAPLGIEGVGLDERRGRTLYPTFDRPVFGKIVRGILDSDTPLTSGGPVRQEVGGLLRGILDRPPRTTLVLLVPRRRAAGAIAPVAGRRSAFASFRATTPLPSSGCCNCGGNSMPGRRGCSSRSPIIRRWSTIT